MSETVSFTGKPVKGLAPPKGHISVGIPVGIFWFPEIGSVNSHMKLIRELPPSAGIELFGGVAASKSVGIPKQTSGALKLAVGLQFIVALTGGEAWVQALLSVTSSVILLYVPHE